MPTLTIVKYPEAILRVKAKRVDPLEAGLRELARDLFTAMAEAEGVGLAATQVGVNKAIAVIDCSGGEDAAARLVLINPEVIEITGEVEEEEGCLSFPGVRAKAKRAERCRVRAFDLEGRAFEVESGGLLGKALQHETDHLNGRLFIDHLGLAQRALINGKLKQMKKDAQEEAAAAGGRR